MQKALLIISIFALSTLSMASYTYETQAMWEAWKIQHKKSYSADEEMFRFAVFSHNYKKILKFNDENDTPKLALNKFADLSADEFKSQKASCGFFETDAEFVDERSQKFEEVALPDSVDWRNKGAVTPVKDQGQCGSCWAFSTTGVLEGFHFIKNGNLLSFSEQQIVDCDTTTNQGCDGGYPYLAVQYAIQNGLEVETDYPYTAADGNCAFDKSKANSVIASNYSFVTANSTDQLKSAIVNQPVSVLIEADQDVFQFYNNGVIKTGCGANLDHAVLVVGYHKVGILEAFIVKNSWGVDWGESGYVEIWSNSAQNNGQGVCGILAQPMVPSS